MNKIKKKSTYLLYRKKKRGMCFVMDKKIKNKSKEKEVEVGICEVGEDTTKYGEFISTYFAWLSLPQQKEKVEELEKITKKEEKRD